MGFDAFGRVENRWRSPIVWGLFIPILILLLQVAILRDFSIDDVGISYRYALHLAQGKGLNWNPGHPPVEGYSNFLWVVILAGGKWLGLDIESFARTFGVILGIATLVIFYLLCRRFSSSGDNDYWWFPVLLVAANPIWTAWLLSGLEIALYGFLLVLVVYGLTGSPGHRVWLLSVGLAGLLLTRPEGLALTPIPIICGLFFDRSPPRSRRMIRYGIPFLIVLTVAGALAVFRLIYFGYPLPNTVYAKFSTILPSKGRVAEFLVFCLPFFVIWIYALRGWHHRVHRPALVAALALVLWQMVIILPVNPVMNFLHRYLIAFLPLVVLPVLFLLQTAFSSGRFVGVAAIVILAAWSMHEWPQAVKSLRAQQYAYQRHLCVTEKLSTLPGRPLIAILDAGRVPYLTDLPAIDVWGLCDHRIAHDGFSADAILLGEMGVPDVYIMAVKTREDGYAPRFGNDVLVANNVMFGERFTIWEFCTGELENKTDSLQNERFYDYALFVNEDWALQNGLELTKTE